MFSSWFFPSSGKPQINYTVTRPMSGKAYDSVPLTLAQLASGAADIIALGCRADHHTATRWGYSVLRLGRR
jgi:hypothetical protein